MEWSSAPLATAVVGYPAPTIGAGCELTLWHPNGEARASADLYFPQRWWWDDTFKEIGRLVAVSLMRVPMIGQDDDRLWDELAKWTSTRGKVDTF